MRELIKSKYDWFLPVYDAYPTQMHRADAARYFILHYYGGVFIDMDYVPQVDITKYLSPTMPSFVESPFPLNERVGSALMSSPAKHPFWEVMFKVLVERRSYFNVVRATGPGSLTAAVEKWERESQGQIHVLSCENFFRIPNGEWGQYTGNWVGRGFRWFLSKTSLTKDCGKPQDGCLYGIHYNTMLFM
jgi:mannosyltransferase OCH1-like enzyme